ncbi:hypothetical protein EJ02DRAFT_341637 [Clathrospora elynae]|uniref:Uncharacterized protein n=1 Tax=Clathrospora elynae TaxID=706981 RepID=A0A6A5SUG4_9PLEO|nr:hypothetical protein EJ02DRAFT_341637 [Clathrospora elynae]
MLRRAPTTITLTQADIEQWEANRQRKIYEAKQKLEAGQSPEDTTKLKVPAPPQRKSREDRIMGGTGQGS